MKAQQWLCEPIHEQVRDLWWIDEVLCECRTQWQEVLIARTPLGVTLFCDGNPQSAEIGQLHFHEAELLPAATLAEQFRRVLVIGCGEGVVPQIAERAGAERVDHVDLDPECVRLCAEHLPYGYDLEQLRRAERGEGAVRLRYGDGLAFLERARRAGARYDVIVLDLPEEPEDPADEHDRYLRGPVLQRCRSALAPGGVVSTHVSRPHLSVPTAGTASSLARPWREFGDVFGTRVHFRSDEQPWAAVVLGRADAVERPVEAMRRSITDLRYRPRTLDERTLLRAQNLPRVLRNG